MNPDRPRHIVFLCDEYPPGPHGGIGSLTQTMGRSLAARGHNVSVLGVYRVAAREVSEDQGVTIIRLPHASIPWTGILINGLRLRRALRELHAAVPIDVIEGPELAFSMVPRRYPGLKIIRMNGGHHFFAVTLGKSPRAWRSWLERRSFAAVDHVCAVSRFVTDVTGPMLGLDGQVDILPNPVDVDQFRPALGPSEPGLIVFVGTLCEKKGVRELVRAMPDILAAVPETRLRLIGRDSRDPLSGGSYAAMLRGLLPAEHAARVEFIGHVDQATLPEELSRADVAVFPSHMEAQGLVIVEAMACGKAVVTGGAGPGPEIVEHGRSGLLCDPHSPASIAEHVIAVLRDPQLRARLGRGARERAVAVFSNTVLAERTEQFYERCIAARSSAAADYAATAVRP